MWSFLAEFTRRTQEAYIVIVMDAEQLEAPRQYRVHPQHVLAAWLGSLGVVLLLAVVFFSPLGFFSSSGSVEMRREAQANARRLAALEDSLAMQQQYVMQLRRLMTGQVDTSVVLAAEPPLTTEAVAGELANVAAEPQSKDWADHRQPALSIQRMQAGAGVPVRSAAAESKYLSSLKFPVVPPVQGLLTRGFDARKGHYAIDIAVDEGTVVRSIGDGHVIMADWTHDGGYTTAIQHADGYVSVYKHNQRLLKRVGDRVREREAVAVSGNTGEITTGPHLHFELWRNGLAQDPRYFFIGE